MFGCTRSAERALLPVAADWALVEVDLTWLSIVALVVVCGYSPASGWLRANYARVSFAAVLNAAAVQFNGPFGGSDEDRLA